ncbi:CMRF35-like molecule 8 [Leucoraja erinacea]|uniref:CMRF35-like molecule 8 n=1 Tax=Leucoraja erinaceus TaxID=7782 RepID=UPI0024553941|nr:CMRF35-like molecule 8 [Leucoraja erinacea]
MENEGKNIALEQTFNSTREGNNSISLFIPKIGHRNRWWTCLVFNRQMPRSFTTIQLEVTASVKITYLSHIVIPMVLVLLLCLVGAIIIYHSRIHKPVNEDQRKPASSRTNPNTERCSEEIHYAAVRFKKRPVNENPKEPGDSQTVPNSELYSEEEIHYAVVSFQKRPGNLQVILYKQHAYFLISCTNPNL